MENLSVAAPTTAESVVRQAAVGDELAFARLIAEHNAAMARVAFVIVGEREATLDAVQNAWSIAWRKIGSVREPSQIRPWLVAIAANEARQHIRRKRGVDVVDISHAMHTGTGFDPGVTAAVVDLERALRGLSPDDRRLLALRFVADLNSAQIARQLGLSASGVRSRLSRLIDRLRTELEEAGAPR
jgi:RNA polymerase sigma-70 factor (ECF subfamily)